MLRCLAIDDEPLALELLEDNIGKVPFLQLVAKCDSALQAIEVLEREKVDLVFLDIQMPGLTGLQLIKSLTVKPMFILVTAYEKYALEGFDLEVVDYLVKPVSLERFIRACNKARELHQLKNRPSEKPAGSPDYFFVNIDYSQLKVNFNDILYIEGLKDYVKIHLKSSPRPLIPRISIKSLEETLPNPPFLRVHKSFIVSATQVTALRKGSIFIGEIELPVGEAYRDSVAALAGKQD